MEIINNPSKRQLDEMQKQLDTERNLGIVEIWCAVNPLYFLAEDSGECVGVLSISMGEQFAEIYKLYIPSQFRRKGYGKELFSHAISYLSQHGITEVCIEAVGNSSMFWNSVCTGYECESVDDNKCILQIVNG